MGNLCGSEERESNDARTSTLKGGGDEEEAGDKSSQAIVEALAYGSDDIQKAATTLLADLQKALKAETAQTLLDKHGAVSKVIDIDSNTPVLDAFKVLCSNNIRGAPVWDDAAGKYVGVIDLMSVVEFIASKNKGSEPSSGRKSSSFDLINTELSLEKLALENTFEICNASDSVFQVASVLARPGSRMVGINSSGGKKIDFLVTQSSLFSMMASQDCLRNSAIPIQYFMDNGFAGMPIASAPDSSTALDVFRIMAKKKWSALGIGDESKISYATCSSDVRIWINSDDPESLLQMNIVEFFQQVRRGQKQVQALLLTISPGDSLSKCIGKLIRTKQFKIYVVGENLKTKTKGPQAVLSLTDLLKYVTTTTE